ncbi:MAG TPA: YbaK/EbsC family protein [Anaeromyxobacteraceae bacterium]|nr:YbaK/EbsC family protein [Anaeromyxobacteraceae bacterium]
MIPTLIDAYLHEHGLRFEHLVHGRTVAAQRLAAAEHIAGQRVAKVVVLTVDGRLSLAVVAAPAQVDLELLRRVLGAQSIELAPEEQFADLFSPCEAGAEPPLSLFGLPIFVDAVLTREPWLLMRGGTHEDAIQVDTDAWLLSEKARIVDGLGATVQ